MDCQQLKQKTSGISSGGLSLGFRGLGHRSRFRRGGGRLGGNLRGGLGGSRGGDFGNGHRDITRGSLGGGFGDIGGSRIRRGGDGGRLLDPEGIDEGLATKSTLAHGFGELGQALDEGMAHALGILVNELDEGELGAPRPLAGVRVHVVGDHEIPHGPFGGGGERGDVAGASDLGSIARLGGGGLGRLLVGLGGGVLLAVLLVGIVAHTVSCFGFDV